MYKNEIYVKMLGLALPYIRNLQQLEKKEKILNLSCYHLQAFNSATGQIQEEPQLGLDCGFASTVNWSLTGRWCLSVPKR